MKMIKKNLSILLNRMNFDWYLYKYITNKWFRLCAKGNEKFRNAHQGERCFILGNGPSLRKLDFVSLSNEYTFTMNRLMKMKEFFDLKPNFHVWADDSAFDSSMSKLEYMDSFKEELMALKEVEGLELFITYCAMDFIHQNGIDENVSVNYMKNRGKQFIDGYHKLDFTSGNPGFVSVAQYAIWLAIYMGFTEIYLLGCDSTIILDILDAVTKDSIGNAHVYKEDGHAKNSFVTMQKKYGWDYLFYTQYDLFRAYRNLGEYCRQRNIRLINLTEGSLIDTLPVMKLEEIL